MEDVPMARLHFYGSMPELGGMIYQEISVQFSFFLLFYFSFKVNRFCSLTHNHIIMLW